MNTQRTQVDCDVLLTHDITNQPLNNFTYKGCLFAPKGGGKLTFLAVFPGLHRFPLFKFQNMFVRGNWGNVVSHQIF